MGDDEDAQRGPATQEDLDTALAPFLPAVNPAPPPLSF